MDLSPAQSPTPCEPPARLRLGNVPLTPVDAAAALGLIAQWAGREPFRLVVTPNVDHVMELQRNPDLRAVYERAELVLADGVPLIWAARWLGLPPLAKVSGSDLVGPLCERAARQGWRLFFAGGNSPAQLEECLSRLRTRYPGLRIAGACPPFGFERDPAAGAALVEQIRRAEPDLVLLGCGMPKSEIWLDAHRQALGRGVGLAIGVGLLLLAGLERRAPRWMQRLGLEWLWRLAGDPRRLWRRYLVRDMQFFPLVWRWKRERTQS